MSEHAPWRGMLAATFALASACSEELPRAASESYETRALAGSGSFDTCMQAGQCSSCPSGNCVVHSWLEGEDTPIASTTSHLCVLSGVQGGFGGITQRNDPNYGTYWSLAKASSRSVATCVPFSNFKTDQGGVAWLSERFEVTVDGGDTVERDMWWGDAASFLAQVGFNEYTQRLNGFDGALIIRGNARTASKLGVWSSGWGDDLRAAGYSFFVGVPHSGDVPRMYRFLGTTDFFASAEADTRKITDLATVDEALCYLTGVQGDMEGDEPRDQWTAVIPKPSWDGTWRWSFDLRVGGGEGVAANAACIYYDQCKHPEQGCVTPAG